MLWCIVRNWKSSVPRKRESASQVAHPPTTEIRSSVFYLLWHSSSTLFPLEILLNEESHKTIYPTFPSCYLVKFYPLFLSVFKSGCNDHCYDLTWVSHMQATLSSISSFSAERQWSLLIPSHCSCCASPVLYCRCAPHLSCPVRAELEVQYCSSIKFTKTGGEFKALKVYNTCTKEVSSVCFVFDYMCFYLCAHSSSWMAERTSLPVVHPKVGNMNSELFSSSLAGHALMPWSRMEACLVNHSLALIRAIFPGKLGICLQELQELHYRKSFKMLQCLECFILFI